MRDRSREVTRKAEEELRKLRKYYLPTKCYVVTDGKQEVVECRELVDEIMREGRLTRDYIICNERKDKCLKVGSTDELVQIPVEGTDIFFTVDDCDSVKERDLMAYIITGKGEVRTLRSPIKGDVVLIHEVLGEKRDRYLVIMRRR